MPLLYYETEYCTMIAFEFYPGFVEASIEQHIRPVQHQVIRATFAEKELCERIGILYDSAKMSYCTAGTLWEDNNTGLVVLYRSEWSHDAQGSQLHSRVMQQAVR